MGKPTCGDVRDDRQDCRQLLIRFDGRARQWSEGTPTHMHSNRQTAKSEVDHQGTNTYSHEHVLDEGDATKVESVDGRVRER